MHFLTQKIFGNLRSLTPPVVYNIILPSIRCHVILYDADEPLVAANLYILDLIYFIKL